MFHPNDSYHELTGAKQAKLFFPAEWVFPRVRRISKDSLQKVNGQISSVTMNNLNLVESTCMFSF